MRKERERDIFRHFHLEQVNMRGNTMIKDKNQYRACRGCDARSTSSYGTVLNLHLDRL